jgi:formylglycine-generating enzyme required for sulfatase activity
MGAGDEDELSYPRSVRGFYLDRFEVTVDRLQYFQANYVLPNEGDGAHPLIPGTGWQEAWEQLPHPLVDGRTVVPADGDDLLVQLTEDCGASTWSSDDPLRPANCVNWYVAFAFCAFDGGRLPTEAEWNYAAAFGQAQRPYPWSVSSLDTSIDATRATFYDYPNDLPEIPTPVGTHELGRGGFYRHEGRGHDDLAGNVSEWTLDEWLVEPPSECGVDCFASWTAGIEDRVTRGGAFQSTFGELFAGWRTSAPASNIDPYWGFRCARDLQKTSALE